MAKDETAVQDAGAPETAPEAPVAAAPSATAGDDSSAPVELTRAQLAERLDAAVAKWRSVHLYSTPLSRATEALNYLNQTAVPDLVSTILKEIC